jgi:hypothetical protein
VRRRVLRVAMSSMSHHQNHAPTEAAHPPLLVECGAGQVMMPALRVCGGALERTGAQKLRARRARSPRVLHARDEGWWACVGARAWWCGCACANEWVERAGRGSVQLRRARGARRLGGVGAWREHVRGTRKGRGVALRPAVPGEGPERAHRGWWRRKRGEAVSEAGAAGRRERRASRHSRGGEGEAERKGGGAAGVARAEPPCAGAVACGAPPVHAYPPRPENPLV